MDILIGAARESLKDVADVIGGVDVMAPTGFHDRVEDGAHLSGLRTADEEVIFLSHGRWADAVLQGIVIDLYFAVFGKAFKSFPLPKDVGDGLAKLIFGQCFRAEYCADSMDAAKDHRAFTLADSFAQDRSGFLLPQTLFDLVQELDLPYQQCRPSWIVLECLVNFSSCMSPAAKERQALLAGEGLIDLVAVTLEFPFVIAQEGRAGPSTGGLPVEDDVVAGNRVAPKVA